MDEMARADVLEVPAAGAESVGEDGIRLHPYHSPEASATRCVRFTANVLTFLEAGRKRVATAEGTLEAEAGDFLLFRAGHCLMTEAAGGGGLGYRAR